MPINKYYGGKGKKVMKKMKKQYGAKKGKKVFCTTSNARDAQMDALKPVGRK